MTTQQHISKKMNTTLWIAQWLLALFMLMGTALKFMPIEKISVMMPWTGQLPSAIVRLLGVIDLLGGLGLILPMLLRIKPQLTVWAANGIILLMICAAVFHVSRGEASVIATNIIALVIAAFISWGRLKIGYRKNRFGYAGCFSIAQFCSNKKNSSMKIVLTGSLGNIGKPLAQLLVQNNHSVTVISSKAERQKDIEALGAKAAIGAMQDADFLTATFKGADIVYLMESLGSVSVFNSGVDVVEAINEIGNIYKQAVERSGVKKVVHLSSIGAHTNTGNGMLVFHYNVESILKQLPADVAIKFMRPVGFYYNMLAFIPTIKATGSIIQNYGGDEKEPWVSPSDIASVIAEEMETPFTGRNVRYIASEELSPNEIAKILGESIGKPDLKWQVIPDEQMMNSMIEHGMNPKSAKGLVEMNAGRRSGILYEDYNKNRPVLSKTKLAEFAKEFALTYTK